MPDIEKGHQENVTAPAESPAAQPQGYEPGYGYAQKGPRQVEGYEPGYGFASQRLRHKLGNPGPLGLFSFASTTFILSLFNVNARHITTPNLVVGMALFCGGLAQLLAGMWEFAVGNTFGATAFSSYGAFWLSFATILIPNSGIGAAYAAAGGNQEDDAIAIFLTSWMIVTFFFFLASLRKNVGLSALFFFLTLTFMLLAIGDYNRKVNVTKAGGGLGIVTAFIAYYVGFAELMAPEDAFQLPLINTAKRLD